MTYLTHEGTTFLAAVNVSDDLVRDAVQTPEHRDRLLDRLTENARKQFSEQMALYSRPGRTPCFGRGDE